MKTVRKYRVIPFGTSDLPFGKVLLFAEQDGQTFAWVEVELDDKGNACQDRRIVTTKPTGADVPYGQAHLASCITSTGLVWHLYEVIGR